MPGSGKSTLATSLGERIGYNYFDLDDHIEQEEGKTISEIFEEFGEDYFRELEARKLRLMAGRKDRFVLSCGGGTPCYHGNMELINRNGCSVFISISLKELVSRLGNVKGAKRPLITPQKENLEQYLERLLDTRLPFYNQAHISWEPMSSTEGLISQLNSFPKSSSQ